MSTEQPNPPTEAEIAAANEVAPTSACRCRSCVEEYALTIAKHNAPLHAKIEKQKAALGLALNYIKDMDQNQDGQCYGCGRHFGKHDTSCEWIAVLAKIKEALQ